MAGKLSCQSLYEDENFYWFSEIQFNGFYQVDKKTLKPELLFRFPQESLEEIFLYPHILKVGEWFVFAPQRGNNIVLYQRQTKEVKVLPLKVFPEEGKIKYSAHEKFLSLDSDGNNVFFFPLTYPAIVKLELQTMTLTYQEEGMKAIQDIIPKERNRFFNLYFRTGAQKEGKVYLPLGCSKHLGIYDMKEEKLELVPIECNALAFHDIFLQGEDCYLTPRMGSDVVCWNIATRQSKTFPLLASVPEHKSTILVQNPFVYENSLYLCPWRDGGMYQMNLDTEEMGPVEFIQDLLPENHEFPHFSLTDMFCIRVEGDFLSFLSGKTHDWYRVNLKTKECSTWTVEADDEDDKIFTEKLCHFFEKPSGNLDSYLQFLKKGEFYKKKEMQEKTIGQRILEESK